MIHYDGDAWNLVDGVPTLQSLNSIWGYDAGHVFVVGDWGTILRFDGEAWTTLPSGTTEHLVDIWGRNPHDVYAVGLHGTLLHFDGSTWTIEDTGHDVDFLSVWGYTDGMTGTRTVWIGTRSNLVLKQTMPSATFVAAPTSGHGPITTVFTNTSASGYTSPLWDFGDGITSTMDSPTHTYTANGVYTVTLDVTWPDATDTAFKPGLVQVYEHEPVSVSFTASPTIGVFPMTVWFTGTVAGDYDEVLWDFGDGYTGTQEVMTHTYDSAGYFNVELAAQGPGGMDRAFRLNQAMVLWSAAVWFDASPLSGFSPLTVTLTGGCIGQYETGTLDFGDGNSQQVTQFNLNHTYTVSGRHTAILTCSGPWNTAAWPKLIDVWDTAPPTATLTANPISGTAPLSVSFGGGCEGYPQNLALAFGGDEGGTYELPATHEYLAPGVYTATLSCDAPAGSSWATETIAVTAPPPPVAYFEVTPEEGVAPLTVTVSGGCSGVFYEETWHFGDGTITNSLASPQHVYQQPGQYNLQLWCNGPGNATTWGEVVNVWDPVPPTATLTATPISGTAPLSVSFGGGCEGYYQNLDLAFGGDEGETDELPTTHEYVWAGVYTATLSCDAPAGSSWATETITVTVPPSAPTATFSADVISGTAPLTVTFTAIPSGTVETWLWSFGDGEMAFTGPVVTHTYVISDTLDVSLTISSTHGSSVTSKPSYITVRTEEEEPQYSIFLPLVLRSTP
ncbi:MAG: PKD domain-containing protein [Anaerolineae bacterium]|nr:PKD domain-containing protein [Anaerolineae bacterium]